MKPLVVHVHIPHTGGTSVKMLLENSVLRTASYNAAARQSQAVDHNPDAFIEAADSGGFDAVTGHLKHFLHDGSWTPPFVPATTTRPLHLITVLRHPVLRSRYDRPRYRPTGNFQTAYILDVEPQPDWDEADGDAAFEKLCDTYLWVARCETLSRAWTSLCLAIGLEPTEPLWENSTGRGPKRWTPSDIPDAAQILACNRADARLCELVAEADADGIGIVFNREP